MRVIRGRAGNVDADHDRTGAMVQRAVETGEPALRVWTPHRQVAFGRRDARTEGYDSARAAADRGGYPPVERDVGGRAVAFTGSTLAVVHADPGANRTAIQSRYEAATARYRRAFDSLGVDVRRGEPDASFCPGIHSLQATGKLAGLAQRVRRDVAVTAGVVVVRDDAAIADVLAPVYDALDVPFDPETVDSVAAAGGPSDPEAVADAIVDAYGGDDAAVERLRET
ncbi:MULTISPECIES: lipoyl protein ligase domain-containing protein [Salinibaculum]|uniref:lipoyl protein ligase domain-containing protein n=1 Tax=Salinibaculum TaxID=2732368 RepID=UPI0030CFE9A3